MKKRNIFNLIFKLLGLVDSFIVVILMAVINGTLGFILSMGITTFAGLAIIKMMGVEIALSWGWLFGLIIGSGLLRGALRYLEQYSNHYIAFKILAILRSKIFKQLRKLSPAKLEGKDKGELISLLQSDIETLEVFYAHTISPFLIAVSTSICVLLFIGFMTSWWFSLYALIAYLIIGGLIPVVYYKSNNKEGKKYRHDLGKFESFYLDSIYGGYEIIASNNEEGRMNSLNKRSDELIETVDKLDSKGTFFKNLTNTAIVVLNIGIALLGGLLIHEGVIENPRIILAFMAFTASFGSVLALANLPANLTMTFASGNRVLDLLEEEPLIKDPENPQTFEFDNLKVKDVEFKYEEVDVLKNINFEVNKNEIIGLLGPSGCGKSTILKLLMKFYEADKGSIEYNGIDIKNFSQEEIYNNVNLFSQSTYLFTGTIYENLIIAKPDATKEEIIEACKNASIYDYILNLKDGLDTKISDLKDNLSSGEKQRLGLARVFLKKPKLLLLDEATANIDAINEGIILNALKKYKDNMSIVIISHRKSTLSICDRTYTIDEGVSYES